MDVYDNDVIHSLSNQELFRGTFLSPNYTEIGQEKDYLLNYIKEVDFEKHSTIVVENVVLNRFVSFKALKRVLQKFGTTGIRDHVDRLVDSVVNTTEQSQQTYKKIDIVALEYARWTPSSDDFVISCDAMEVLLKLDCHLQENSDKAEKACLSFFERFGSHFHVGPFTFGGYLLMGYNDEGIVINRRLQEEVSKEMHLLCGKGKHKEKIGEGELGDIPQVNSNDACSSQNQDNVHYSYVDGSDSELEIRTFSGWKNNLKDNKQFWVVVSKGILSAKNMFGIWTLVRKHRRHFQDADKIANFLSSCWLKYQRSPNQTEPSFVVGELEKAHVKIKYSLEDWRSQLKPEYCCLDQHNIFREMLLCLEDYEKRFGRAFLLDLNLHSDENFATLLEYSSKRNSVLQTLRMLRFCEQMEDLTCVQIFFENQGLYANICMLKNEIKDVDHLIHLLNSEISSVVAAFSQCKVLQTKYLHFKTVLEKRLCSSITDLFRYLLNDQQFTQAIFLFIMSLTLGFDMSRENEGYESTIIHDLEQKVVQCRHLYQLYERNKAFGNAKCQAWLMVHLFFHHDNSWKEINSNHSFLKNEACKFESEVSCIMDDLTVKTIHRCLCNLFHFCGIALSEEISRPKFSVKFGTSQKKCVAPKKISKLLQKIDFDRYFPEKLKTQDALQIQNKMSSMPEAYADIPWVILRKIICIDHNFRDTVLNEFFKTKSKKSQESIQKAHKLHPSDVFLVIFQCCDPFLKQILTEKIYVCQMAVPFIYTELSTGRTTISLWPLRQIFVDDGPKSVVSKDIKTISFIRVGDTKFRSKSHLINVFLRDHYHNTFFHKNCPLGTVRRTISNGVVEITWYIPKSRSTQHLNTADESHSDGKAKKVEEPNIDEPLTILNLRGDASKYDEHLETVLQLSDITIVLADFRTLREETKGHERTLRKIHESDTNVIIITDKLCEDSDIETANENELDYGSDSEHSDSSLGCMPSKQEESEAIFKEGYRTRMKSTKDIYFCSLVEQGNDAEVREYLAETLKGILPYVHSIKSLEEKTLMLPTGCFVDEEIVECRYGKELAYLIFSEIQRIGKNMKEGEHIKDMVVPLQSETLWSQWSTLQKEEHRCGQEVAFDSKERNKNEMKAIRVMQVLSCNYKSEICFRFLHILNDHVSQNAITQYFLHWLKQNLDSLSRISLPKLGRNLLELSHEYESSRSKTKLGKIEMEDMQKKIQNAEKDLAYASFGLEHLFREMGQVYESFHTFQTHRNTSHLIGKLPFLAAELLIRGHPLEIMDGDTANIPLEWVNAVLTELNKIVGTDKRVLTVSVIGIQSSGKSTLLNAMFGLKFSVSAGRCTRGLFVQLVLVDKTKSKLNYDYVIIIDTEGLRAPELAGEKMHHDNKLATLVIGLADVAIINVKGENITDMQDVLQIVIHAMIRLKHANENIQLQQNCIFVHQNVPDEAAKEKTFRGYRKTVQHLDAMTHQAAEEEQMVDIKYFNEVIAFDPNKHIEFFPDLWHGRPPMAPASPEYSKSALETLECILFGIADQRKTFLTIENIRIHLQCLWEGIMSENFVFSFRNALEVKAYGLLEKRFQGLCWSLEELKLRFLEEELKPTLRNCKTNCELKYHVSTLQDGFSDALKSQAEICEKELEEFFKKTELNEYIIHWKGRKNLELNIISTDIMRELRKKLYDESERCRKLFATNEHLADIKRELTDKVFQLAITSKGNKDLDIALLFDSHWKGWMDEYAPDEVNKNITSKVQNMKRELIQVLNDKFRSQTHILRHIPEIDLDQMHENANPLTETMTINDLVEMHISVCGVFNKFMKKINKKSKDEYRSNAIRVIHRVFGKINDYFDSLEKSTEYDYCQFIRIVQIVRDGFRWHNKAKDTEGFTLTPSCEIDTVTRVLKYSYYKFKQMIENYEREHSIRIHMERYKEEVRGMFLLLYEEKANYILATELICSDLKPIIKEKIMRNFAVEVMIQITSNEFGNRKLSMLKEILTNLANECDFKKYMEYIEHFDLFLDKWIKQHTIKVYNEEMHGGKSRFEQSIETRTYKEVQSVKYIAKNIDITESPSLALWVDTFVTKLQDQKYILSKHSFQAAKDISVKNIEDFSVHMEKKVESMALTIYEEITSISFEGIQWKTSSPFYEIKSTIWKCTEVCPLCHEPCALSSPLDIHSCVQHKPNGTFGYFLLHTGDLTYESCSYKVSLQSRCICCGEWCNCRKKTDTYHFYKDYKKYIPNWKITSTPEQVCPTYWAWFLAQFSEDLASYHGKTFPRIPDSFKYISKEEAISSLSIYD